MIPALNEEENIRGAYETVKGALIKLGLSHEIYIIDDGSNDGTATVVKKIVLEDIENTYLVTNPSNLGQGASFNKILPLIKGKRFAWFPGDNVISQDLIINILKRSSDAQMVLTYLLNQEVRGSFRYFVSTVFTAIYNLTFGYFLHYFNGPGVYSSDMLKRLQIKAKRFSFCAEIHLKMLEAGCSYIEIPGHLTGAENSSAISFRNLMEVIATYIRLVIELRILGRRGINVNANRLP